MAMEWNGKGIGSGVARARISGSEFGFASDFGPRSSDFVSPVRSKTHLNVWAGLGRVDQNHTHFGIKLKLLVYEI
jgi:hypothetical protein